MKRSKRLQPVLKLAELEVEKGVRALGFMQQKLDSEVARLSQLQLYQLECRENMQSAGKGGISAQELTIFNHFTQKVDVAIEQQQEQITLVTEQLEQIRGYWQSLDKRHRSLQKMIEKIQAEESRLQSRQEQRNHDEYARRSRAKGPWQ